MERQNISTGSPWEPRVGFSRAVRVGNQVFFSGTLDTDEEGKPIGEMAYGQALNIFRKFEIILRDLGGSLESVVRTRMFLVDVRDSQEVSRAHAEVFGNIRPAATMVVVKGFLGEGFLVEIEADAILN
ncbi:MAG TPA: RidA family protein [Fimbriimonas sp.]|nr:RidA family protein [Fimbriimonas sp.]